MRGKYGLRALGLCVVAALAFVAFSAASAQAAEWLTEGNINVTEKVPIEIEPDIMLTFSSTTGANNTPVKILCENEDLLEGNLEPAGKATGTLSFTECRTFLGEAESKTCVPQVPIISNGITAELFEMGGEAYVLLKPTTGTTLAMIKFPNKECILNPEREISGTAVVKDCNKEGTKLLVKHLIEEASEPLFASGEHLDSLKFGTKSSVKNAHFTGSVFVRLKGLFLNRTFGAVLH